MSTDKRKTVLITGCSTGGIGSHLAKEYHAKGTFVAVKKCPVIDHVRTPGLRVFATARRLSAMEDLRELEIECLQLDVTKIDNIRQIRDEISQLTGGVLDILVNNAGASYTLPFIDMNMDDITAMFDINLFGVMRMVQEFIHLLIASGDGRIVNIGSIAGIMPIAFGAPYAATKAGLHAYGNTLRVELAPFNVKVITIITGGIKSNIANPENLRTIPPDSLYQPMSDDFVNKRQGRSQKGATPTHEYARAVVAATLKTHSKAWVWCGNFSRIAWFLDTFFPRTIYDFFVARAFGLDKLKRLIQGRKKTD